MHTALDTSGRLGERLSDDDLAHIDLNILDIKSGDPATYEKVTRQPLQPTLDYARRLSADGSSRGCAGGSSPDGCCWDWPR